MAERTRVRKMLPEIVSLRELIGADDEDDE